MSHPKGPPPEEVIRRRDAAAYQPEGRDVTPAVGTRGEPAHWGHDGDSDAIARYLLNRTAARDVEITSRNLEDAFLALTTAHTGA